MACSDPFLRSIKEQIAINQSRTPHERFMALCELLDAARAIEPRGPEADERRRRINKARERERERWREERRRLIVSQRGDDGDGA